MRVAVNLLNTCHKTKIKESVMVKEVNNIDALNEGKVLIDFYTQTCGPCRALNPVLEEISKEFEDLQIAKIDVTENPALSQQFGVVSLPTVIFMENCKVRKVIRGLSTKEAISSMIRESM
jgi:thioredoxin 1